MLPNSLVGEKILNISPEVKGGVYYVDQKTIEFRPESRFDPGTSYEVELMSVPVDAKNSTVLEFSDGTYAIVMSDWEGNGFGALWVGEYERVGVK